MNIIEIENLTKSYGDVKAVNGVSFSVKEGSLFAFLGVNGAGKSTTINVLCSLIKKDGGKVIIDGMDLDKDGDKIKGKIGVVFQNGVLDETLTVKDNLTVRASYYGLYGAEWKKRLKEISAKLNLDDILSRPYAKLSGGQKRRVDIARGIIHNPKILFLDEPTTGLDPKTRQMIWGVAYSLMKEGTTIFLTTHYMEEADAADDVVIIDKGKVIATGTPQSLKARFSGEYIKIYGEKSQKLDDITASCDSIYERGYYKLKMKSTEEAKNFITKNADLISDFEVIKGNMDDVFLSATGRQREEVVE